MSKSRRPRKGGLPPELVQYYQARAALKRNIRRFRSLKFSEHGQKWVDSQISYWERRLHELEAHAPDGAVDY